MKITFQFVSTLAAVCLMTVVVGCGPTAPATSGAPAAGDATATSAPSEGSDSSNSTAAAEMPAKAETPAGSGDK